MLLPLSQSLYVEGELAGADSVLLDIGTGYYLEVRTADAAPVSPSDRSQQATTAAGLSHTGIGTGSTA
jgi:prefoldin subunit 5